MAEIQATKPGVGFKDITNLPFGCLRPIRIAGKTHYRSLLWECLCDPELGGCGSTFVAKGNHLRTGHTLSCGCTRGAGNVTHGLSDSAAYRIWNGMKRRCMDTKDRSYPRYGGRGIKVCERWLAFENFYADMWPRPEGMSIERINNDGDYCPENCKWATTHEQNRNTRRTRMVTLDGRTQCLTDWAMERGISIKAVRRRIDRGWSVERAIMTPYLR